MGWGFFWVDLSLVIITIYLFFHFLPQNYLNFGWEVMIFTTSGLFFLQILDIKFGKDSPSNFWGEDVNGRWRTPTHSNNSSECLGWPKNRYENQDQKPNCSLVNFTKFCIAYLLFLYVEQVIFVLLNLKYAPIGRKTYMYINWALFYIFKYKKLNKPTHQKKKQKTQKPPKNKFNQCTYEL